MVLWELLTSETPYRDVDQAAIIYGVGTNRLQLPLPPTVPAGFILLMKMCWNTKPRNRPSFSSILLHLSIASAELINEDPDQYSALQSEWKTEVRCQLSNINRSGSPASSTSSDHHAEQVDLSNDNMNNNSHRHANNRSDDFGSDDQPDQLLKLKHVNDIRALYEEKLERVNNLYAEVASLKAILEAQAKKQPK